MIHTDGTPTIANAPARIAPSTPPPATLGTDDALLERSIAGVQVTLHYFANLPVLRVVDTDGEHTVIVPKDKAFDAFEHPYLYIAS